MYSRSSTLILKGGFHSRIIRYITRELGEFITDLQYHSITLLYTYTNASSIYYCTTIYHALLIVLVNTSTLLLIVNVSNLVLVEVQGHSS